MDREWRVLQPVWDAIREGREEYLGSPLFPVIMSVTFYFVAVFPFMIIDLWGKEWHWVQKYKIQANKEVRLRDVWFELGVSAHCCRPILK